MVQARNFQDRLKGYIGMFFAVVAISAYILIVFTFMAFVNSLLLLGLIVVVPPIVSAGIKKDKKLVLKRSKAACWALGCLILLLFPAFWLIPQQTYVRVNRQSMLITPNASAVESASSNFLALHLGYGAATFEDKAQMVTNYSWEIIEWKLDYETYGLAGHVATPTQCIALGADDCQGQAVTLASMLINLGFQYVWAVETPFHWYVVVRDPAKGALPQCWEKNFQTLQESGEILWLNHDGNGSMPSYRWEKPVLIFNDKETLYPLDPFQTLWECWTATGFFVHEVFPIFRSPDLVFLIGAIFALGMLVTQYTSYMTSKELRQGKRETKKSVMYFTKKWIITSAVILVFFFLWYSLQWLIWDYTLIMTICGISLITLLSSDNFFWDKLRIEY
ncbi:MAG: hypothetical protein ACFFCS_17370 [Candidatus Hodarchaeota archaeon]